MSETTALPTIEVKPDQLPVYCPNPNMPIWNHHPRVFLDVASSGEAMCPYCGTQYRLQAGAQIHSH